MTEAKQAETRSAVEEHLRWMENDGRGAVRDAASALRGSFELISSECARLAHLAPSSVWRGRADEAREALRAAEGIMAGPGVGDGGAEIVQALRARWESAKGEALSVVMTTRPDAKDATSLEARLQRTEAALASAEATSEGRRLELCTLEARIYATAADHERERARHRAALASLEGKLLEADSRANTNAATIMRIGQALGSVISGLTVEQSATALREALTPSGNYAEGLVEIARRVVASLERPRIVASLSAEVASLSAEVASLSAEVAGLRAAMPPAGHWEAPAVAKHARGGIVAELASLTESPLFHASARQLLGRRIEALEEEGADNAIFSLEDLRAVDRASRRTEIKIAAECAEAVARAPGLDDAQRVPAQLLERMALERLRQVEDGTAVDPC